MVNTKAVTIHAARKEGGMSECCIESLEECTRACLDCVLHAVREGNMVTCVLICLDCADLCATTLRVIARNSIRPDDFAKLCVYVCRQCVTECRKYEHAHCQNCANVCERCAMECEKYVSNAHI